MTIFTKSLGCTKCDGHLGYGIVHMIRPEYEEYIAPHYNLLIDDDLHFVRRCSYSFDEFWIEKGWVTAGDSFYDEFWQTYLNETTGVPDWKLQLNPQETIQQGCALFDGNYTKSILNQPVCAICLDGYMDSKIVDVDGNMKFICMNDFCKQGQKKRSNVNGVSLCEDCQIANCTECYDYIMEKDLHSTYLQDLKFKDTQELCAKCQGGFKLSDDMKSCINMHAEDDDISEQFEEQEINIVLESFEMDIRDIDQSVIDGIQAKEQELKFSFIQQAMQYVNNLSVSYTSIKATIWITRGYHHFFQCSNLDLL